MAIVPATNYTQADLDTDITAITDSVESVIGHVGRIKDNWTQVQALHPGVTAVDYIRDHVPYLHKNTAAAVALVEAGKATVADAERLTGRTRKTITAHLGSSTQMSEAPKPTTLKTGTTAPGPRTKKKEKPPTMNYPVIQGIAQPVTVAPTPSPVARDALALIKAVADIDTKAVASTMTAQQSQRIRAASKRARRVLDALDIQLVTI